MVHILCLYLSRFFYIIVERISVGQFAPKERHHIHRNRTWARRATANQGKLSFYYAFTKYFKINFDTVESALIIFEYLVLLDHPFCKIIFQCFDTLQNCMSIVTNTPYQPKIKPVFTITDLQAICLICDS